MVFNKKIKSKKGQAGAALIGLIPFFLIVLLLLTGTLRFLFMDKMPLILIGILIVLFLLRKKRREG